MATASSPASLPADCPACALVRACRDEPHPLFVAELASGVLVLHGASAPAGRLQLVAKHHVPDVLALSDAEREALWRDLDLVVRAVRAALAPLRLNMAGPADGLADGHLVWELVPRAGEDEAEAARPWWELPADPLDLDTAAELKRRILRGFLAVSPVRRLAPAPVRRRP
jgi:diadenosine tetraphosphate (Ap4A) HIT family hydrolase